MRLHYKNSYEIISHILLIFQNYVVLFINIQPIQQYQTFGLRFSIICIVLLRPHLFVSVVNSEPSRPQILLWVPHRQPATAA